MRDTLAGTQLAWAAQPTSFPSQKLTEEHKRARKHERYSRVKTVLFFSYTKWIERIPTSEPIVRLECPYPTLYKPRMQSILAVFPNP